MVVYALMIHALEQHSGILLLVITFLNIYFQVKCENCSAGCLECSNISYCSKCASNYEMNYTSS